MQTQVHISQREEALCNDTSPPGVPRRGHWGDDVVPCWEVAAGTAWQELGVQPDRPWPGKEAPTQHQQDLLQLPLPGREVQLLRVEPQLLGPAGAGREVGLMPREEQPGMSPHTVTPPLPPRDLTKFWTHPPAWAAGQGEFCPSAPLR